MARFDKLEFEPAPETSSSVSAGPEGSPTNAEANVDAGGWLKRAEDCRRRGVYENALRYYSRALEVDKTIVAGWLGQVQMLIMLKEYPEADVWSRKSLELFPSDGDLMAARAQALCRRNQIKQAYASVDGAMNQPGNSAYRWMVRGELLVAGRQSTDRHCFDKAVQIDGDWLICTETALIYLAYGQPANALSRARTGVERAADAQYTWYVQGLCQMELGLADHARKSFNQVLEQAPGHRDAEERLNELSKGGSFWKRLGRLWNHR